MRTLIFVAFAISSVALAADTTPPVKIRLGEPRHITAPPGSATAGSTWVEFPVNVSNTSDKELWLEGYSLNSPFYSIVTRQHEARDWQRYTIGFCGFCGTGKHQLPVGSSTAFRVAVPARYIGQQIRVDLPIFVSSDEREPMTVSTDPATVK